MSLYDNFVELLEKWESGEFKEEYPNTSPEDESRMLYDEGLCENFEDMMSKKGITITPVDESEDLVERKSVYQLNSKKETAYICFHGDYDSYQSAHPYEGYRQVTGKKVEVTEWEDV